MGSGLTHSPEEFQKLWPEGSVSLPDMERAAQAARGYAEPDSAVADRWYESLVAGQPDFGIYAGPDYAPDIWACWVTFSRPRLQRMAKLRSRGWLDGVSSVLDLGCGIGYTTLALQSLWPDAKVYGTNVEGLQTDAARSLGVTVVGAPYELVDLVFASEYFEHFERPLDHLADVLLVAQPRYMIVANSFGAKAPGHFDVYRSNGQELTPTAAGRAFGAFMRHSGWKRVREPLIWNTAQWTR